MRHLNLHTRQVPFKVCKYGELCIICGKLFQTEVTSKRHLKVYIEEKLYNFEICDRIGESSLSQKTIFVRHLRKHIVWKPFICETCVRSGGSNL